MASRLYIWPDSSSYKGQYQGAAATLFPEGGGGGGVSALRVSCVVVLLLRSSSSNQLLQAENEPVWGETCSPYVPPQQHVLLRPSSIPFQDCSRSSQCMEERRRHI